jgi:hypothetical protein
MATPQTFEGEITLRFLFANFDGINKELTFPYTTRVSEIKERLLANWPEKVTQTTAAGMRLLTAGRLLEDGKTLAEAKVPKYPDHATPVNISFLPKGRSYTEVTSSPARPDVKSNAGAAGGATAGTAAGGGANNGAPRTSNAPPNSGGCCVMC